MLRIGGTDQDALLFNVDSKSTQGHAFRRSSGNFTMGTLQWDAINQYANATGWEVVFGLNVLLRTHWPAGDWDTTNAVQLINYTISRGHKVNWELGNGKDTLPDYELTNKCQCILILRTV